MELSRCQGLRRQSLWREIWCKWLRQELEDARGGGIYEVPKRHQLAAQSPGASRGSQSIQHLLCPFSCVRLSATLRTVASQALLSMRFSWGGGLPGPPPRDLTDPWIEPMSPTSNASKVDS